MQQFIRYLYEYSNGRKVRNIGFVKVEKQEDKCTMHIHGKGVEFGANKNIEVFVFFTMDGVNVKVSQGSVDNSNPVIHFILRFEAEDIGGVEAFEAMRGIILQNNTGKKYVAVWDDTEVDADNMISREEWEQSQVQEPVASETTETPISPSEQMAETTTVAETQVEEMQDTEETSAEEDAYIPQPERIYEKISRKDLSRLPRKEWRLANNSFLLHGFYNYHHLLYIKEGENCWIGVPGIYYEKEQMAAKAFGFPQFHRITDDVLELSEEEINTYEDFGYWCRSV